jgi:hypothetical protein
MSMIACETMRRHFRAAALLGFALLASAFATQSFAKGNLASKPTELKLVLNGDLSMSEKEFKLETGKYYKLAIESRKSDEFHWMAPDLFNNVWVYQVVIAGIEVHNVKSPEIEFDKDGTATIYFVPVRTGRFKFYVKGQEERGMLGTFIIE